MPVRCRGNSSETKKAILGKKEESLPSSYLLLERHKAQDESSVFYTIAMVVWLKSW